jgi:predicted dehydrogenase
MNKLRVGILGCGNISANYIKHARMFSILDVVSCADLMVDRAKSVAAQHGIPKGYSVEEMLADKDVDLVINLTIPAAHGAVALAALRAGKHVWNEKPLALDRQEGQQVVAEAQQRGLRLGGAPDTFFGAGHQTARRVIDSGAIGKPVAVTAFMMCPGHERWHPNPEFFYKPGGGPMFDMGPYYLTAMLNMFGPMKRVMGFTSITRPTRVIGSEPLKGKIVNVETPDHYSCSIEFHSGVIGTLVTSFATWFAPHPPITVFGSEGSLSVPDPNGFDGKVQIRRAADAEWTDVPFEHRMGYGRSVGVADMAHALVSNRPHRASGQQIFAVLDAMQASMESSQLGKAIEINSPYERPAPLPTGLAEGVLD